MVLRDAARQVFRRLMDAVDPDTVEAVELAAGEVEGVHRAYDVENRLIHDVPRLTAAVVHTEPAGRSGFSLRHPDRTAVASPA